MVTLLAEAGADLNLCDFYFGTPLMGFIAKEIFHHDMAVPIVEAFLAHGSQINQENTLQENALVVAIRRQRPNYSVVQLLVQRGARLDSNLLYLYFCHVVAEFDMRIVDLLLRERPEMVGYSTDNSSVVLKCCEKVSNGVTVELLKKILAYRADSAGNLRIDLNQETPDGQNPITILLKSQTLHPTALKHALVSLLRTGLDPHKVKSKRVLNLIGVPFLKQLFVQFQVGLLHVLVKLVNRACG